MYDDEALVSADHSSRKPAKKPKTKRNEFNVSEALCNSRIVLSALSQQAIYGDTSQVSLSDMEPMTSSTSNPEESRQMESVNEADETLTQTSLVSSMSSDARLPSPPPSDGSTVVMINRNGQSSNVFFLTPVNTDTRPIVRVKLTPEERKQKKRQHSKDIYNNNREKYLPLLKQWNEEFKSSFVKCKFCNHEFVGSDVRHILEEVICQTESKTIVTPKQLCRYWIKHASLISEDNFKYYLKNTCTVGCSACKNANRR